MTAKKIAAILAGICVIASLFTGCTLFIHGASTQGETDDTPSPTTSSLPVTDNNPNAVYAFFTSFFNDTSSQIDTFNSYPDGGAQKLTAALTLERHISTMAKVQLSVGMLYQSSESSYIGSMTGAESGVGTVYQRTDGTYGFRFEYDDGRVMTGELGSDMLCYTIYNNAQKILNEDESLVDTNNLTAQATPSAAESVSEYGALIHRDGGWLSCVYTADGNSAFFIDQTNNTLSVAYNITKPASYYTLSAPVTQEQLFSGATLTVRFDGKQLY